MAEFDVRNAPYNATGDGSTIDTDAIRNAANAARNDGGGVVYLPAGNYLINNTIFDSFSTGTPSTFQHSRGTIRDHNHWGFTTWLAGGGVKGGQVYGATDEFGFKAVDNPVHVHDLHATILRLLGFDHTRLTYRYAGRDFRLTDVSGNVISQLIA